MTRRVLQNAGYPDQLPSFLEPLLDPQDCSLWSSQRSSGRFGPPQCAPSALPCRIADAGNQYVGWTRFGQEPHLIRHFVRSSTAGNEEDADSGTRLSDMIGQINSAQTGHLNVGQQDRHIQTFV